ncbi:hypothetical protein FACS189487_09770 [Campylobacterota bacterium]|nr:hypothetical protein FACS189487_09770 [Campylobacterota bacterium]
MRLVLTAIALFFGISSAFAEGQNCVRLSIGGYRCDDSSSDATAIGSTTAQQTAQPAKEFRKNRIDANLGVFLPIGGDGVDLDFDTGVNFGIGYTRFLTEEIGAGVFVDSYSFKANKAFDISSTLVGAQVVFQKAFQEGTAYGALKVGRASATAKPDFDGLSKDSFDGSGTGFIIEVGTRKKLTESIDAGLSGKYKYLKMDFDGIEGELDLSGFALAVNLGVAF